MKLALVVAFAVAGCDSLFNIHRIDIAAGSNMPDAPIIYLDAASDPANCGTHDEDGDGAFDKCDGCPTVSDKNDGDGDHDGVGNLCDPDQGAHNTIEAFYSFQTGAGFSAGATFPNDKMLLSNTVASTSTFTTPERIVLGVELATLPVDVQLTMNPGGSDQVICELATTCPASSPTCLYGYRGTTQVTSVNMTLAPSQVTSLVLSRNTNNDVQCSVNDFAQTHTITVTGAMMPSGKLQLSAPVSAVTFPNLIVYNVE